jgi:hypothetical protein
MAAITPLQLRAGDIPSLNNNSVVLQNLNTFFRQVTTALNNGLTIAGNMVAKVAVQQLVVNSLPLSFKHGFAGKCVILVCGQAAATDGTTTPAFFPTWHDDGAGNVVITAAQGLTGGETYTCTFVCFAG